MPVACNGERPFWCQTGGRAPEHPILGIPSASCPLRHALALLVVDRVQEVGVLEERLQRRAQLPAGAGQASAADKSSGVSRQSGRGDAVVRACVLKGRGLARSTTTSTRPRLVGHLPSMASPRWCCQAACVGCLALDILTDAGSWRQPQQRPGAMLGPGAEPLKPRRRGVAAAGHRSRQCRAGGTGGRTSTREPRGPPGHRWQWLRSPQGSADDAAPW